MASLARTGRTGVLGQTAGGTYHRNPPQLTARLAEASLDVDEFQLYMGEVLDIFPLDWADSLVNKERSATDNIAPEPPVAEP